MSDPQDEAAALLKRLQEAALHEVLTGDPDDDASERRDVEWIADALRAAEARGFEEARERAAAWHRASRDVVLEQGMGAHSVAFCEGWVQAHSESDSHHRALQPQAGAPGEGKKR